MDNMNSSETLLVSALPSITVQSVPGFNNALELGPNPGIFQFTRTGDLSHSLTVNFTLSGSAIQGRDYLAWEQQVVFAAGASEAYISILPKNDLIQENSETVKLTINAGATYNIGISNSATINIQDTFVSGLRGVFDPPDSPTLAQDLQYLDAQIVGGNLVVDFVLTNPIANNIEFFLDTDQNPSTGDIRFGHIGSAEFRVSALVLNGLLADYQLFQLPRSDAEANYFSTLPGNANNTERLLGGDTIATSGSFRRFLVPLSAIGNPRALDIFAVAHRNDAFNVQGNGDRASEFGAVDTSTGQLVVRQPGRTHAVSINDLSGDSGNAADLVSANFSTIGDRFRISLSFANPINTGILGNLSGEVVLDTDRSMMTGGIFMGDEIPSWGGDVALGFAFLSGQPQFTLRADGSGRLVTFGDDRNDGRWLVQGNTLTMDGSLSIFDAYSFETGQSVRVPTNGQMYASVSTYENLLGIQGDHAPQEHFVIDTSNGQILSPLQWDPQKTVSVSDPREYSSNISGTDLFKVDTQVVNEKLVVKGFLTTWSSTDVNNLFEILLDTDMNASTGEIVRNPNAPGQSLLGADYKLLVASFDGIAPVYTAILEKPNGSRVPHEAWLQVQTTNNANLPGSFTATIPLESLGNLGSQLKFFVTTGRQFGTGRLDIAPNFPVVVDLDSPNGSGTSGNDRIYGTSGDDLLDGLAGNDTLTGLAGNDTLIGGLGSDSMDGGTGNDTYNVDSIDDRTIEQPTSGIDTVVTTTNWTLDENLENLTLLGSTSINGSGNILKNRIVGNLGNNKLSGFSGNDILYGGNGSDSLIGGSGDDVLVGQVGQDRLTGQAGADTFRILRLNEIADIITDFSVIEDIIQIKGSAFGGGLSIGRLVDTQFVLGTRAFDSSDRFIYNQINGALYFDRDGNGSQAQSQLFTLTSKPSLTASDIVVI